LWGSSVGHPDLKDDAAPFLSQCHDEPDRDESSNNERESSLHHFLLWGDSDVAVW
jgi:hypothetical protein